MVNTFIYPRTVSVRRPQHAVTAGAGAYSQVRKVPTVEILTGLPASIQLDRTGQRPDERLPADAVGKATWKVFIPLEYAALGTIQSRDVIVDDLGIAYQVVAPYWNSLGFNCRAQVEET